MPGCHVQAGEVEAQVAATKILFCLPKLFPCVIQTPLCESTGGEEPVAQSRVPGRSVLETDFKVAGGIQQGYVRVAAREKEVSPRHASEGTEFVGTRKLSCSRLEAVSEP